jgi:flagellar basal body-associated protein FliL
MKVFFQLLTVIVGIANIGAYSYYSYFGYQAVKALPELPHREVAAAHAPEAGATDAHGNPTAAKPADILSDRLRSWVTLEDMHVNVFSAEDDAHTLSFKLEIELFDEKSRAVMEARQAVVKNVVLEVARDQSAESLATLAGKLYFKESVASQVNSALKFPLVRDVHLASFSVR